MQNLIILIVSALFGAAGQLLLKKSAVGCSMDGGYVRYFISLICNVYAWLGAFSYFISLGLYMIAINRTELSIARSVSAFSYVLVIVLSYFIFSEHFSVGKVVGMIFIAAGIFILGMSGR